jgi:hypothetical protein
MLGLHLVPSIDVTTTHAGAEAGMLLLVDVRHEGRAGRRPGCRQHQGGVMAWSRAGLPVGRK